MATYFSSWTLSMPESELPGVLPAFLAGEPPKLVAAIEEGDPLFTYSRRDWLHRQLAEVGSEFGDGSLMGLLAAEPSQSEGGADESGFLVTALRPSALPAAVSTIDGWLQGIAAEPERLAARLGLDADGLRAVLVSQAEDERALEDGDRPHYLFWFLRHLRTELLNAQSSGRAVVHARYLF